MYGIRRLLNTMDSSIILCAFVIFLTGLLSLYSASRYESSLLDKNFVFSQINWMVAGIIIYLIILKVGYNRLVDFSYFFYAVSIALLIIVLMAGATRLGAQRWLKIGFFIFQPSELAKLAFILALADYLGEPKRNLNKFSELILPLLITIVPVVLILKQPNLGTSSVFFAILFGMLYVAGTRIKHLFFLAGGGMFFSPFIWHFLKDYQRRRLLVFLNPNLDPLGAGYTIIQSKIAIGSGGLFGKGWLSGTQNQLNFLPERHTDFIFSVIGEEWGILGTGLILILFFIVIRRGILIAQGTTEPFGKLTATGIVSMLAFQVIVNVAMSMGLLPVVGLPLPLVSYGGSNLVVTIASLAILIDIKRRRAIF